MKRPTWEDLETVKDGEALATEFERKAATRRSPIIRWWYRRAARSLRRDLQKLYTSSQV